MSDKKSYQIFHPIVNFGLCQKCTKRCGCDNGAIMQGMRLDSTIEVVIIPDKCDGCGHCLVQCPYGAVKLLTMHWVRAITSDHLRDVERMSPEEKI